MRQSAEAVTGCLVALAGGFAGLFAWAAGAETRARAGFESGPEWSVLHTELPLTVLAGAVCALVVWLAPRLGGLRLSPAGAAVRGTLLVAALVGFWLIAEGWYDGLPAPASERKP
ncbi:hypothetical protein [Streptomyces sp. NPDC020141]|uniref:hypothetical protein n=1 Tax=Streptomyces sp. NPDC020141 TaxID=3365065 RepID=UPI0037AB0CF4